MASVEETNENTTPAQLLKQLSQTPYACSSLSPPLSARTGNVVYRGSLAQPLHTHDGSTENTIIVKNTVDSAPVIFDEILLKSLADDSPLTIAANVKAPRLHMYDPDTKTQVLEDFCDTVPLRMALFSANPPHLLPALGRDLGLWLRSFHTWASAPERAVMRAQMWRNDDMRKTKYGFTYGSVPNILKEFPALLEGHRKTLDAMQDAIAKEYERPSTDEGNDYGLLHADFWSGNILLPSAGWQEPSLEGGTNELFVIDWEFAQFGHRSCDLGQIVGDLYERKVYNNLDVAIPTMEGVIEGYGPLGEDMAFRTAIYVGVHLISWYDRRPRKGPRVAPPEVIERGLTLGRDFIVKGWEKDKTFFQNTALASLFVTRPS